MILALKNIQDLSFQSDHVHPEAPAWYKKLKVLYCAICRTDAKMWYQGHHDLVLPRVLGHEIAAIDEDGGYYTVWPGQACGTCRYCTSGHENLCDSMRIIGFHSDGGFASYINVPSDSLIPAPIIKNPAILCFTEPMACVLNTLTGVELTSWSRVIIYGGGVVGLIAGMLCSALGAEVTIVEKNEEKIDKSLAIAKRSGLTICKQTDKSDFDLAINCCDCHIGFSQCVLKLRKGGHLSYFSGLKKNEEIDTNILNLIHYKELQVRGSYGQRKKHMEDAMLFCSNHEDLLSLLIEKIIQPENAADIMGDVLVGKSFKYLIDCGSCGAGSEVQPFAKKKKDQVKKTDTLSSPLMKSILDDICIEGATLKSAAQKKIDHKTKPLGALGRIEGIAVKMCCIQNSLMPSIDQKRLFVFAGDHGVVEEGVSAFPAKVTEQMVQNFLAGGAAINVFCRQFGIDLAVVDMGVNAEFDEHPLLINKKVNHGTRNFALQPAMSRSEVIEAVENGAKVFLESLEKGNCDIVGMGEMGIGNTTSATAIIAAVTGVKITDLVGRGTGVDNKGLERKIEILQKALTFHKPKENDPIDILAKVGGFEIAGICGAILAAAQNNTAVVLDGIISTAAGLLCYLFTPDIHHFFVAGHRSVEHGQMAALQFMRLDPLIDLDMRLGEGTGAAVAINLTELACNIMRDMASFEEAGVSGKNS